MAIRLPPSTLTTTELAALERAGLTADAVSGFNPDIDSTLFEDVWVPGGVRTWLTSPDTLQAVSTDVNDTAAGTGARTLILVGLDVNGIRIEEEVTMNGTTLTAATSQSFFRLNDAFVSSVGTYGANNTGQITVQTSGGIVQSALRAGYGRQENSHVTTPANRRSIAYRFTVAVDATKPARLRIKVRFNANVVSAPFPPMHILFEYPSVQNIDTLFLQPQFSLQPFTDIWVDGIGAGQNSVVGVIYAVVLLPG